MINTSFIPTWDTKAAAEKAAKGSLGSKAVLRDVYKSNNEIFAAGCYRTDSGKTVQLSGPNDPMMDGTIVYSKELRSRNQAPVVDAKLETGVENDDCLRVAKRMLDKGLNPAVLNLADCYTACGWYPRGSRAQEESICRVTTLSRSLYQYYTENMAQTVGVNFKGKGYPMDYHFGGIYSPGVTVFRDSAELFRLMDEPYKVSVISVAALNFRERDDRPARDGQYRADDGGFTPEGLTIMQDKIRTIYRIALVNGHDSLVLGAFGCGAFRLRSDIVARLFRDILQEDEFIGSFKEIRFAILEWGNPSEAGRNGRFAPFYRLFSNSY
ncbi:MAG: TIGR02452 family protein [Bacteroidales bacterium]|nr:TIGR02452 family protein [Bacteroidales bacterium]